MKANSEPKKEPKITKRDIARMKELGDQMNVEDKIVVTKLENKKLNKEVYVTSYNWLHNSVKAIVITPKGRSNELIKIKDIEAEQGLLPVHPFKEKSLSELELLQESASSQILLDLYNWASGKDTDNESNKKDDYILKAVNHLDMDKELGEIQKCRSENTSENNLQR